MAELVKAGKEKRVRRSLQSTIFPLRSWLALGWSCKATILSPPDSRKMSRIDENLAALKVTLS